MAIEAREQQIAELRRRMDQLAGRLGQGPAVLAAANIDDAPSRPVSLDGPSRPVSLDTPTRSAPSRSGNRLPQLPGLQAVPSLLRGAVHQVDNVALALALVSATSAEGGWLGVIGLPELGYQAALEAGIELARTIVIPEPGEHWMLALTELSAVTDVVLMRPAARVSAGQAEKLCARFRISQTAVLSLGSWPRCELSYRVVDSHWFGAGQGEGYLTQRRAELEVVRNGWPASRFVAWLPGHDLQICLADDGSDLAQPETSSQRAAGSSQLAIAG